MTFAAAAALYDNKYTTQFSSESVDHGASLVFEIWAPTSPPGCDDTFSQNRSKFTLKEGAAGVG